MVYRIGEEVEEGGGRGKTRKDRKMKKFQRPFIRVCIDQVLSSPNIHTKEWPTLSSKRWADDSVVRYLRIEHEL